MVHIECLATGFGVNADAQATGLQFKASMSGSKRLQHFKQCRGKLVKGFILMCPHSVPTRGWCLDCLEDGDSGRLPLVADV